MKKEIEAGKTTWVLLPFPILLLNIRIRSIDSRLKKVGINPLFFIIYFYENWFFNVEFISVFR